MTRRSKAREVAVQMLYQIDLNPDADLRTVRAMIDETLRDDPPGDAPLTDAPTGADAPTGEEASSDESAADSELAEFAWRLFVGVREMRPLLDEKIQAVAENWSLKRMAPTDRNVLRLGLYELLQSDVPHRVVLDEAIELARLFGSDQSAKFVNGLLDKLVPAERKP